MEKIRRPFQGVWNIIRFNWQFYFLSLCLVVLIMMFRGSFVPAFRLLFDIALLIGLGSIIVSLVVSAYVYDFSNLYTLSWLDNLETKGRAKIININAGFDETSYLLKRKFQNSELVVFDFYDPVKHTEASIRRARKAYPPFPDTQQVNTADLPLESNSADEIFVIFSAHEIRNETERKYFFKELHRILAPTGHIILTEHLRDAANCWAYNIGAFHFYSKKIWLKSFQFAELNVKEEIKVNPFVTTYILTKNGIES